MKNPVSTILSFILVLLSTIVSMACSKEQKNPVVYTNPIPTDTAKKIRYLALGDSYTIGQGVAGSERFPAITANMLKGSNIVVVPLQYIATTGWTTLNLINAIAAQNPVKNNDIVTLLIGVNDQYQNVDTGTYRTRFTQLISTSIELAGNRPSRVFVLSIPDYSATPFVPASEKSRVSKEIDWFNAINKQVTLQYKVAYTDITPSTRQAAVDPTLIATDGLHPSGKEYAKWASMLEPLIKAQVK